MKMTTTTTNVKKDRMASTKDVLDYLGISRTFLSKEMASGRLKAYKIGHSYKFQWKDVEAYVNASVREPEEVMQDDAE